MSGEGEDEDEDDVVRFRIAQSLLDTLAQALPGKQCCHLCSRPHHRTSPTA